MDSNKNEKVMLIMLEFTKAVISCGGHTTRINSSLNRISKKFNLEFDLLITYRGVCISVWKKESPCSKISGACSYAFKSINMNMLSLLNHLTWDILEKDITEDEILNRIEEIKKTGRYSPLLTSLSVSLSCAGFCYLFGGKYIEMPFTFIGAFLGMQTKIFLTKHQINHYLTPIFSAFVASFVAGLLLQMCFGEISRFVISTCVLFLIPGVAIITATADAFHGYNDSSISRLLSAFGILTGIAIGIVFSITILGFKNWM
ncbi:threonine/serine exporter family protein [Aureibacter tunicatorum]|uniref:Uncharacterized membrane protein YjjP (DUF1212 family) n=1 Tax=Aureibacter tunicatorum TaxID=866807 RepID=A0AAE3XNC6_9BACT|nr:threonine/serine exporter family protein [Aureibacter tunicatorum]MDR6239123.1 uncharacterized membrane protein YjjP (DUF1212 family) [Aureibacter tunicatorum]BDD04951.1 hypothetical protein AUTU_24340 [Aureibacter tunicatorum]